MVAAEVFFYLKGGGCSTANRLILIILAWNLLQEQPHGDPAVKCPLVSPPSEAGSRGGKLSDEAHVEGRQRGEPAHPIGS